MGRDADAAMYSAKASGREKNMLKAYALFPAISEIGAG